MAELGLLASGITVAALIPHIARGIVDLKDFISSVQNAPKELHNLISGIESLTQILDQCASNAQEQEPDIGERCAVLSLEHCQAALGELKDVVCVLLAGVKRRRKLGGLMAVLKRGEMERLGGRLESAKSSLMLSRQVLLEAALAKDRESLLASQTEYGLRLESIQTNVLITMSAVLRNDKPNVSVSSVEELEDQAIEKESCNVARKTRSAHRTTISYRQQSSIVKFRLPFWMRSRGNAFEFGQMSDGYGAWTLVLRGYSVIPNDSAVIKFVRDGNINAIQDLFSKRLASPQDVDEWGRSLVFHATTSMRPDVCELLLRNGAKLNEDYSSPNTEIRFNLAYGTRYNTHDQCLQLQEILARHADSLEAIFLRDGAYSLGGSPSVLQWTLNQVHIEGRCRSVKDCGRLALLTASTGALDLLGCIRVCLEGRPICREICQMHDQGHVALLDYAAGNLGYLFRFYPEAFERYLRRAAHATIDDLVSEDEKDSAEGDYRMQELVTLIRELILGGSKLHRRSVEGGYRGFRPQTPFVIIYETFGVRDYSTQIWYLSAMPPPVLLWLHLLQQCGVDLDAYGRKEKGIHSRDGVGDFDLYDRSWEPVGKCKILFTYGPQPEDWKIWFCEIMDDRFLHFWEMVENPETGMPGAWIEDDTIEPQPPFELFSDDSESEPESDSD